MCASQPISPTLQDEFKLYSFLTTHVHVGKASLQDHFNQHPDHQGTMLLGHYEHKWSRFHLPNRAILLLRPDELVVAFGCTYSLRQYLTEFDIRHVPLPSNMGQGTIHAGFYKLYQSVQAPLLADLSQHLLRYRPKRLTLSGFSLGGTGCILLLLELLSSSVLIRELRIHIAVYTYGTPPLLDPVAASQLNKWITHSKLDGVTVQMYRIIGEHDLVPFLIPKKIGFVHYDMPGKPYYVFRRIPSVQAFATYESTNIPIEAKQPFSVWRYLLQWTNSHLYYTDITSIHWKFISSFRL
jgi:hypothetical protein